MVDGRHQDGSLYRCGPVGQAREDASASSSARMRAIRALVEVSDAASWPRSRARARVETGMPRDSAKELRAASSSSSSRICRCRDRVPDHLTDQLRVECDATDRQLTILECHPPWREDVGPEWTRFPIARLHFSKARQEWTLYWRDRNLRFHLYERVEPARDVSRLLAEVDRDPTAIFWG